jgi:shikimate dehydrogenase
MEHSPSTAIGGTTRLAGVIGWPVAHSRSPRLHNHWLRRHGIDGAYVPLPVRPGALADAVRGLRAAGFRGCNVTLPHKEEAFRLCDTVDDAARDSGACNTLVFTEEGIEGSATDGPGFVASLAEAGVDPAAGPALLLGAGGAARCIAQALVAAGAPAVLVANRSAERAAALADMPGVRAVPWPARGDLLADAALLVNATSAGMDGKPPLDMPLDRAGAGLAVADIVYVPRETALLAAARARGLRTVEGIGMLLHQARPGFAAWFGAWPAADDQARAVLLGEDRSAEKGEACA